ncbi:MAG TPA: 30S ribosomal protein THX [Bacteroidia bacterium]|nr:30S ribosomal protein THX [Bacteroidia bacterium]
MGKGDRRSRKGKIWAGSYGNSRKRKKSKAAYVPKVKKAAPKAAVAEEVEAEVKAKKAPAKKAAAPKKKAAPKKTEE